MCSKPWGLAHIPVVCFGYECVWFFHALPCSTNGKLVAWVGGFGGSEYSP